MRREWFIAVLLAATLTARADDRPAEGQFVPLAYKVLRFDENYQCLSDPAKRTDLLDPLKYMALRTNEPAWYLTVGGEVRERFEGSYDPNFGVGPRGAEPNAYWLQRITLLTDVHLGDRLRFFAEGISGVMQGERGSAPKVQDDPVDLMFAFAELVPYRADDESLTLRGGRFGLSLGSGRLVATRAAPNIPFRFDGVEAIYKRSAWEATAFLTRPVEDRGGLSGSDPDITFWGLYVTHWLDGAHRLGWDVYYLGIINEDAAYASGSGYENRHSFGTRLFGNYNGWDWNGEGVVQVGEFAGESILAWTASLDSGYTWDARLQPRLGLKVDAASGDTGNGHQGSFNALYFKSGYFNDASLIRPVNLIDIHPNLTLNPTRTVTVDGGVDVLWRYTRSDAVYAPPGFVAIPAGPGSAYVGTALDVNGQWHVQRHLTLGASYVHFFSGSYVRAAGGRDVDFVSTTLSFLF